jgi:hypothetical protein
MISSWWHFCEVPAGAENVSLSGTPEAIGVQSEPRDWPTTDTAPTVAYGIGYRARCYRCNAFLPNGNSTATCSR